MGVHSRSQAIVLAQRLALVPGNQLEMITIAKIVSPTTSAQPTSSQPTPHAVAASVGMAVANGATYTSASVHRLAFAESPATMASLCGCACDRAATHGMNGLRG